MGVNHVTTADGEELINLMSDTVDEYSLLEGATAHDASGEQIRGKAVYVNPNLLDNPDFSINQRGQTEYDFTDITYGNIVDCWGLGWAKGFTKKLTVSDDGITLSSSGGEAYLYQKLENPKDFYKKTFTFSLSIESISGNALISAVGNSSINGTVSIAPLVVTEPGVVFITFTPDEFFLALRVQVRISDGGSIKLNRVKLEPGAIQTLARQDDEGNWVIIDPPPNRAIELLKCQRYLVPPPFVSASGYAANANVLYFLVNLPTDMRTRPSLMEGSVIQMRKISDNSIFVDNLMASTEYTPYIAAVDNKFQVIIGVNKPSHGLNPQDYYLSFIGNSGGFSAEL